MSTFSRDLYRYFGATRPSLKETWQEYPQLMHLRRYRKLQAAKTPFVRIWHTILLARSTRRTHIQLFSKHIGEGLRLGHLGPVVVSGRARIGKNCNLASGVTIGATNRGPNAGAPILDERVWVGTNAVLVGNITIGSDVLIAPNSYINFDVPAHSIVIGNPGSIYPRVDATRGYLENLID